MILAVTIVSLTLRAVAEFQLWIRDVRSTTDGATMMVGGIDSSMTGFIGTSFRELYGFCFCTRLSLFPESVCIDTPGHGEEIEEICSKIQKIGGQNKNGQKIVGEHTEAKQLEQEGSQGKKCEESSLYRDDKENQKRGIGIHRGVGQEQGHMEAVREHHDVKEETCDVQKNNTGEIVKGKFTPAPGVFYSGTKLIIEDCKKYQEKHILSAQQL